jgi:hypothetical protein
MSLATVTKEVTTLSEIVPDNQRAKYREVHDAVESWDLTYDDSGQKAPYESRTQKDCGRLAVCEESQLTGYFEAALEPLKFEECEECKKFKADAVNQAKMVVFSESHVGHEDLFKCEYGKPNGTRWLAYFVVKSQKIRNRDGTKVRYAIAVCLFADICTLKDGYSWRAGHLSGDSKERVTMWMKWKLVMAMEEKQAAFAQKVQEALASMRETKQLPSICQDIDKDELDF